jgi:hypothetical protein
MKNITLAIDEDTLKLGREYARKHKVSFNILVRRLIEQTVKESSTQWLDEAFTLSDKNPVSSNGKKWKREDLYRA